MKQIVLINLFLISVLFAQAQRIFYVDNVNGSDENKGLSPDFPWKTIEKINRTDFLPDDQILLKRGGNFTGQLSFNTSGKPGNVIKLGAYGVGSRPVVNAGKNDFAILLLDAAYWEISDMETTGGDKAGIFVGCTCDSLELNHIKIRDCYVHTIGDTTKFAWELSTSTGGIVVENGSFNRKGEHKSWLSTFFNEVSIENCVVRYNRRWTCLSITSGYSRERRGDSNFIRNCITEYSVADGIRMNGVQNSRMEYCFMYKNGAWPKEEGRNLGGLGAWFFNATNCTIQYCEAANVRTTSTDGGAFDIDYWQENSTVQYCYGHHCAGYGVSVFGADPNWPTVNSTVRYNILANNGRDPKFLYEGDFFIFTWLGGLLDGVNIHDNLSIWNPSGTSAAIQYKAQFTGNRPNTFTNNTIVSAIPQLGNFCNDSLKSNHNVFGVSSSEAGRDSLWTLNDKKYASLSEWQTASGLDTESKFENTNIGIPAWYRLERAEVNISNDLTGKNLPSFSVKTGSEKKTGASKLKGNPVLLAFVNLAEEADKEAGSRSQLVFLKSMLRQYEAQGLKVLVADMRHPVEKEDNDFYTNFRSDNPEGFELIPVGKSKPLAQKMGVENAPATFLISANGSIVKQWGKLALPAQLAFAIEDELK